MRRQLERAAGIDDLRTLARRRLPRVCFDWLEGGAGSEWTLRANRAAFESLALRPRYLVDVAQRDLATVACGTPVSLPVLLAPAGLTRIVRRDAELAVVRAAGRAGTVYCLSTGSSVSLEDVARAATGPLWFQLYLWRGQGVVEGLVSRAREHGYEALVVTVDVPVSGRRERDVRNGFTLPLRLSLGARLEAAVRHPAWVWGYLAGPEITFANLARTGDGTNAAVLAELMEREFHDPSAGYDALCRVREAWPDRLLVKGTLTAEDAHLAAACGVDGIVVSNHGGRQLDFAPASLAALPEIVAAVGDRVEVLLDSGVRRGSDVVKALALGASAVLVGRPYLYGLAAAGEPGVTRALEILRQEIDTCLGLLGRRAVSELDESCVVGAAAPAAPWTSYPSGQLPGPERSEHA